MLPQVGTRGIPNIQAPPTPEPPMFTEQEFDAMPLSAKGKILKYKVANDGYVDIVKTGFRLWREWAESLFGKE